MYTEGPQQQEARQKSFTYHKPHGNQPERYTRIRDACNNLAALVNNQCPPSRELSLFHTKLEEAVMWANAAIARNEKEPT